MGGDTDRYDAELRPELMRRAIEEIQDFGIEVDIWKIEGVDEQSRLRDARQQTRSGEGREGVVCVVLGRGASDEKVDHWLRAGAPVEGYIGFAIGRSIWWDALKGFLDGSLERDAAAEQIADNYLRFVEVYQDAEWRVSRFIERGLCSHNGGSLLPPCGCVSRSRSSRRPSARRPSRIASAASGCAARRRGAPQRRQERVHAALDGALRRCSCWRSSGRRCS